MKRLILVFLLGVSLLWSNPLPERLKKAQKGDFIVTQQGKTQTLLRVQEANYPQLILEEISFPSNLSPPNWQEWILKKAPGHVSWVMYEIDLEKKVLQECYSFSKGCFLFAKEGDHLLKTFLELPCEKVAFSQRRKIGPPPVAGEKDNRSLWKPPLQINGKNIPTSFEVYSTIWPKDSSPLSEKTLELYFDQDQKIAFPTWIQVKTEHVSVFSKVIDAGKNLSSFYSQFPRRAPFVKQKKNQPLSYLLSLPAYCLDFELILQEETKTLFPNQDFMLTHIEGETYLLTLKKPFPKAPSFLLIPKKYPYLFLPLS